MSPARVAAFALLLASVARAADAFTIDLELTCGDRATVVHAAAAGPGALSALPPRDKPEIARPAFKAKAGEAVEVKWVVRNASERRFNDVVIHEFAVVIDKPGQDRKPKDQDKVPHQSALSMDFRPADRTTGRFKLTLAKPGCLLLRLETMGLLGDAGREFTAEIDIVFE